MRLPFCIFKLQSDRSQHFVEAAQALDNAKARVQALAELWSGEYVIINEATGERVYRRRQRGIKGASGMFRNPALAPVLGQQRRRS